MYTFETEGLYDDWCIIKKNDKVIYEGNPFTLTSIDSNNDFMVNFDYGEPVNNETIVKKYNRLFITIPYEKACLYSSYKYEMLIFDENDFDKLLDISGATFEDAQLIKNITNTDVLIMWMCTFDNRDNYVDINEMYSNIISEFISTDEVDCDIDIKAVMNKHLKSNIDFSIRKITSNEKTITVFLQRFDCLFEWKCLVKNKNGIYLKVGEYYIYVDSEG